jgi:hypothetical protein
MTQIIPVALAHITMEDDGPYIRLEVLNGEFLQPGKSPVRLYALPPVRCTECELPYEDNPCDPGHGTGLCPFCDKKAFKQWLDVQPEPLVKRRRRKTSAGASTAITGKERTDG